MDFGTAEVDRTHERAEVAWVVYSVLTSQRSDAAGRPDEFRLRKVIGMFVVEAGVHIRFVGGAHGYCSHWRMRERGVVI